MKRLYVDNAMNTDFFNFLRFNRNVFILGICFLFFFFFFFSAHPVLLFDSDDWTYISATRPGVPIATEWNPTRVLPEVFMPMCADFAISVLYPVLGDIQDSFIFSFAIVLSFFVVFYVYSFLFLLENVINVSFIDRLTLLILFILLHFLVFRVGESGNSHLFYSNNATCYFYYVIPGLLCASLTFWGVCKMSFSTCWKSLSNTGKGLFVLLLYLCILSNLFQSIIIVACAFSMLVFNCIRTKHHGILGFVKCNILEIIIICSWLIVLCFEYFGGRSQSLLTQGVGVFERAVVTFGYLKETVRSVNVYFLVLVGSVVAMSFFMFYRRRSTKNMWRIWIVLSGTSFVCAVFLFLLCAISGPSYINRADVLFGVVYCIIAISVLMLVSIVVECNRLKICLPLIVFLLYCETNTKGRTFRDVQNINPNVCKAITASILLQVRQADRENLDSIAIKVPVFSGTDNWPIAIYHGERLSQSLFKYGFIRKKMKIEVVPSEKDGK